MTEAPFPSLPVPVEPAAPAAVSAGLPATEFLTSAADRLQRVRDYFYRAEETTNPANMSPLRRYLEYIDGYLDSLSGKDEPLRETRDAVKEVLEETRIRTRNLKYVADIRAKSIEAGFQVGQLPSWGVDNEAVLRVQSGLEQSIVKLVAGLRALAELAAPAAGGKKSGPGSAAEPQDPTGTGGPGRRPHHAPWPRPLI